MTLGQITYLGWWWFRAKFFGRKAPLQSVVFVSDKCNLSCKHCTVYNHQDPLTKTYEQIREELKYCYSLGSRFIDFEGGEPTLWTDGDKTIDDLCDLAHELGFFSCTITTNAQKSFKGSHADSIWVSMDGVGEAHDRIRGKGTFERLEKNIAESGHPAVSVNMAINVLNAAGVEDAVKYAAENPFIDKISLNFHTPFPGSEALALPWEQRQEVIDTILRLKKEGYQIMNTKTGLRHMRDLKFKKVCWMTNYVHTDGTKTATCPGEIFGICDKCGFCMAGEERAVVDLAPDTILAGLNLRVKK